MCMRQPSHTKDRVAAYVRKVVGAAAKGTRWWDPIFWPVLRISELSPMKWVLNFQINNFEKMGDTETGIMVTWSTLLNRECEYLHGMIDALGTHVYRFNSFKGRYALRTGGLMRVLWSTRVMRRNLDWSALNDWLNWLVVDDIFSRLLRSMDSSSQ